MVGNVGRAALSCAPKLELTAITTLPRVQPGDDLGALLCASLREQRLDLSAHDVLVVASKLVAKAEDRYVLLQSVVPSPRARELALEVGKDPRLIEVVLWDTERISRKTRGALIVRHNGGHVSANAGIDQSNAQSNARAKLDDTHPNAAVVLRLPADADASAERLRDALRASFGVDVGVIISDSFGRPLRNGTVGTAIGAAGFPALFDQRGRHDLDGRVLEATITAPADQIAAMCDLVMGQADEARGAVHVRGVSWSGPAAPASALCREPEGDLYL